MTLENCQVELSRNRRIRESLFPTSCLRVKPTSSVDLHVLLEAALLVEAPPAVLTAIRFLPGVNPLVSLQVPRSLKAFAAVRADEAHLELEPLRRPPPPTLTVAQQLAAERARLKPPRAAARHSQPGVQGGFWETGQGVLPYVEIIPVVRSRLLVSWSPLSVIPFIRSQVFSRPLSLTSDLFTSLSQGVRFVLESLGFGRAAVVLVSVNVFSHVPGGAATACRNTEVQL